MDPSSSSPFYRQPTSSFPFPFPPPSPLFGVDDHLHFALDCLNPNPIPLLPHDLFERVHQTKTRKAHLLDCKFRCPAEIRGRIGDEFERMYKLTAAEEKGFKWTAEIKGREDAPVCRSYSFQASTAAPVEKAKRSEERSKVFLKAAIYRAECKDLSSQDAALIIQMTYRAHLVHRSQVVHALRGLSKAKEKLKEIRALFSNISYRHHLAHNAKEIRALLSEKIISLLLSTDSIEGLDYIVRATKRSLVKELETMLEIVNPRLLRKLGWIK